MSEDEKSNSPRGRISLPGCVSDSVSGLIRESDESGGSFIFAAIRGAILSLTESQEGLKRSLTRTTASTLRLGISQTGVQTGGGQTAAGATLQVCGSMARNGGNTKG